MSTFESIRVRHPSRIAPLSAGRLFDDLTVTEKLYAHHMARGAWLGTRIILRQVSPESVLIFDFILELYRSCAGKWAELEDQTELTGAEMKNFLDYAAVFLQNIGNYYGHGDQKFIPRLSDAALAKLSLASSSASELYSKLAESMTSTQPSGLGYASSLSQSSYYLGVPISSTELAAISDALDRRSICPENTRVRKRTQSESHTYEILQASTDVTPSGQSFEKEGLGYVHMLRGDHANELSQICDSLSLARNYVANPVQGEYITKLLSSFESGDMEEYKESQRLWVEDQIPRVETVLGFVEPYRDPHGVRAEFEGLVGIVHKEETELLSKLIHHADQYIASLPWNVRPASRDGKGPLESPSMGYRNFTSIHTLAYCSTLIFPGINLPNFNDIREQKGFKNIMITNSMDGGAMSGDSQAAYILPHESEQFLAHRAQTYYLWVVFHELFGHGTGKLLAETEPGIYNFDAQHPPTNPITGKPVDSWYLPNQTWTGVFGDIATSVDECRAECVGAYLMSNKDLLAMFGFTDDTSVTASDLEYNMYLQLAVAGLRSLESYTEAGNKWGQAHSRGHFAMFQALLENGRGFMTVTQDPESQKLTVAVDRSKIATHGRPALEELTLTLHIFRCTADVKGCRHFYERLTEVNATHLAWRRAVLADSPPRRVFVQPNTFLDGQNVTLKEYDSTIEGVIQSWAERNV